MTDEEELADCSTGSAAATVALLPTLPEAHSLSLSEAEKHSPLFLLSLQLHDAESKQPI